MKLGFVAAVAGGGLLAAGAIDVLGLFSSASAEFSYSAADGRGSMIYRCELRETPEESEANARSAHAFFEPAALEATRLQAAAMAASMAPKRPSAEVVDDLADINASADARRQEAAREMRRRFGCSYRGGA